MFPAVLLRAQVAVTDIVEKDEHDVGLGIRGQRVGRGDERDHNECCRAGDKFDFMGLSLSLLISPFQ